MASRWETDAQGAIDVDTSSTSDYDENNLESETTSLKSSAWSFQYENGRRYHRLDDKCLMPNDEREQDRLDLQHYLFHQMLGGAITLAPLEKPHRILDAGTGTGIWALDAAAMYPSAHVIGVDLTPIQPGMVYSNCSFEVDDLEKDWTWPKSHFDFIHTRGLGQLIRNWPRYIKQMYDHTRPGGYIEILEFRAKITSDDGTVTDDCALKEYFTMYAEACKVLNVEIYHLEDYVQMVEEAGFTDIKPYLKKQPWGPWPRDPEMKKIGRTAMATAQEGMTSYGLALFTRVLKMDPKKAKDLLSRAWKNVQNRHIHAYNYLDIIVARKPEA